MQRHRLFRATSSSIQIQCSIRADGLCLRPQVHFNSFDTIVTILNERCSDEDDVMQTTAVDGLPGTRTSSPPHAHKQHISGYAATSHGAAIPPEYTETTGLLAINSCVDRPHAFIHPEDAPSEPPPGFIRATDLLTQLTHRFQHMRSRRQLSASWPGNDGEVLFVVSWVLVCFVVVSAHSKDRDEIDRAQGIRRCIYNTCSLYLSHKFDDLP